MQRQRLMMGRGTQNIQQDHHVQQRSQLRNQQRGRGIDSIASNSCARTTAGTTVVVIIIMML
jgi:hypothetical protein